MLDELLDRVVGERLERKSEMVSLATAPGRTAIEELGPGESDHQHRRAATRLHHEFDEVEKAVARPVEVLEDNDKRPGSGGDLDHRAPRREQRRAIDDTLLS